MKCKQQTGCSDLYNTYGTWFSHSNDSVTKDCPCDYFCYHFRDSPRVCPQDSTVKRGRWCFITPAPMVEMISGHSAWRRLRPWWWERRQRPQQRQPHRNRQRPWQLQPHRNCQRPWQRQPDRHRQQPDRHRQRPWQRQPHRHRQGPDVIFVRMEAAPVFLISSDSEVVILFITAICHLHVPLGAGHLIFSYIHHGNMSNTPCLGAGH